MEGMGNPAPGLFGPGLLLCRSFFSTSFSNLYHKTIKFLCIAMIIYLSEKKISSFRVPLVSRISSEAPRNRVRRRQNGWDSHARVDFTSNPRQTHCK
jgi:hypothetical protein